jgi:alpha-galactosidase/6-phospho-beta-glucosidase family protein
MLRDKILDELLADPYQVPRSLDERSMPWYPDAVLPLLSAIAADAGREVIVNVPSAEGYVVECAAKIFADRYEAAPAPTLSGTVVTWLERFVEHEKAVLNCVDEPSFDSIYAALDLDPIVPCDRLQPLAMAVFERSSSDVMCPL